MFIRRLTVERFRGIESLEWRPSQGLNALIGPADAGKTTVLNAIALLLDPRAPSQASEYDYFRRGVKSGFHIEAVLGGVDDAVKGERVPNLHGWRDGQLSGIPEGDREAVLVAHVDGTPELDIEHTLTTPSGDRVNFSSSLRRALLLARVTGGDRANTELRLGRGSLLERVVSVEGLRAQLAEALATAGNALNVPEPTQAELRKLADRFAESGLPSELGLRFLSPPGQSAVGMIGLTTGTGDASIPFAYAGQGSRQLALFTITSTLMGEAPVIVIDEPETALEPYRQRAQVSELRRLAGSNGQVFMTTHAHAIIAALHGREVWRLAPGASSPTLLEFAGAERLRGTGALLSRIPILCEGYTEEGFLQPLMGAAAARDGVDNVDAAGVSFVSMNGQPQIFEPATALLAQDIRIGLFIDNEVRFAAQREKLKADANCAFGTWDGARDIEEAIALFLPWTKLPEIVALAAAEMGQDVDDLLRKVGDKAGHPGTRTLDQVAALTDQDHVRRALAEAMGSEVKVTDNQRRRGWFKTVDSGRALGTKLLELGLPPEMQRAIDAFWSEVRKGL